MARRFGRSISQRHSIKIGLRMALIWRARCRMTLSSRPELTDVLLVPVHESSSVLPCRIATISLGVGNLACQVR